MKKLLLSFALITVSFVSANNTKTETVQLTQAAPCNLYVFETSCGVYFTETDRVYSDSYMIATFVNIEKFFCKNTVDPSDVTVTNL